MTKIKERGRRMADSFAKELDSLKIDRIKSNIDKKFISDSRLTAAIVKEPEWMTIKEKLKKMPRDQELDRFVRNKKGFVSEFMLILIFFAAVLIFAGGYMLFSIFAPPLVNTAQEMNDAIMGSTEGVVLNDGQNFTEISSAPLTSINDTLQNVKWFSYAVYFFAIIGFLMFALYVKSYPFLAFVWIFMLLILVFASFYISNIYNAAASSVGTNVYVGWEANAYLMQYQPYILAVFGVLSGIILFVLSSGDSAKPGQVEV